MSELQIKIDLYKKNNKDISELIQNKNIDNLNLSNSIIKKLDLNGKTINGTNFTNAIIGEFGTNLSWERCNIINCNFRRARFLSNVSFDNAIAYKCNFLDADMSNLTYKYAKIKECLWCNALIRLNSDTSIGSEWDDSFFEQLSKMFNVTITKN